MRELRVRVRVHQKQKIQLRTTLWTQVRKAKNKIFVCVENSVDHWLVDSRFLKTEPNKKLKVDPKLSNICDWNTIKLTIYYR